MKAPSMLVIHDGDLPSLVALAMALDLESPAALALLHLHGDQPGHDSRFAHMRKQAEHFGVEAIVELSGSRLVEPAEPTESLGREREPLVEPLRLTTAVSWAMGAGIGRVVWPAQCNGDFESLSRATEQALIVRQLAATQGLVAPVIETPLVELTDREMIEIGAHLDVPWQLAWSCEKAGDQPCHACSSCSRRRAAFDAAGMVDPIEQRMARSR